MIAVDTTSAQTMFTRYAFEENYAVMGRNRIIPEVSHREKRTWSWVLFVCLATFRCELQAFLGFIA